METLMVGKFVRSGLAVAAVAGLALVGGGLPAQAQVRPGVGIEIVTTFYASLHGAVVGVTHAGACGNYTAGRVTSIHTTSTYNC
jgi:hypothetical protein